MGAFNLLWTHLFDVSEVNQTIDHLFRSEYVKLTSFLTTKFGASNIDIIEDAVQESLLKAMRLWSFNEIPEHPGKWLYRVSHNQIIDVLRRQSKTIMFNPEIMTDYVDGDFSLNEGIQDNQLKMMFACCHPSMKETEQVMLSLKLLCGFSNKEIARALFKQTEAVKKAITRAKLKFKTEVGDLEVPADKDLTSRLDGVLKVIYLLFNSGYTAHSGENLIKKEVCEDALRLAGVLHNNEGCDTSELKALIALMCYQLSRFDARIDSEGKIVIFKNQDRSLWDYELINMGSHFLATSANSENFSQYQFEAAIAREYAISKSFENIDWDNILSLYDTLQSRSNNLIYDLNRLVILGQAKGTEVALKELQEMNESKLNDNHLYFSILSNFQKELGIADYKINLQKAIDLTDNQQEKEFLISLF